MDEDEVIEEYLEDYYGENKKSDKNNKNAKNNKNVKNNKKRSASPYQNNKNRK